MMDGQMLQVVSDLSADALPADAVQRHAEKLASLVGSKSGTIPELKTDKLEILSRQTKHPGDFIDQYTRCAQRNTQNLVPMLEVLAGIVQDEDVVDLLQQRKKTFVASEKIKDGCDLESLKERLLKTVASAKSVEAVNAIKPKLRMFEERPLMTNDYPNVTFDSVQKVGPLGKVPIKSQESAIIQDLLYVMVGVVGTHIKPKKNNGSVNFDVDKSLDPSIKELLNRILPMCANYSLVVAFAEDQMQLKSGRVNQALAGAIIQLLKEYYVFVAQLETQFKNQELSLQKLWFYIQPTMQTIAALAHVCQIINNNNAKGGKTLSLLHEQLIVHTGTERSREIGEFLTKAAAKPFFQILSRWIHKGIIDDPGKDFFVADNEVFERSLLPLDYSDDYWERRYSVRPELIPTFLHSHINMIVRTGKYLNVIQQCDKSVKIMEDFEDICYCTNPEEYIQPLEKAYAYSSKSLLDLLVKDKDLIGHLRSVKHYFLLDQGDFIVQFLDLCEEELLQNVDNVQPTRLENLLELALRTSGAKTDPFKDNVCVELLPYDLIFQMCKILSIDTESESEFKVPSNSSELTGLEAFAFGYDVQWPVSLVLNRKSLACYQMLLRHLLYCKHVERLLCSVWVTTKNMKAHRHRDTVFAQAFALKQKMLNFLQNLEYYMTFEVLEPNWNALLAKIRSGNVTNVDQVLQIHSDFLTTCLSDCMLSHLDLLTTVKKLMGVCVEFANYMSSLDTCDDTERFQTDIVRFNLSFSSVLISLLDKISKKGMENFNESILNILHRLDFNGFYTKELDQFGSMGTKGESFVSNVTD